MDITIVLQSNIIGIVLIIITLISLPKNLHSGILADKLFFMLAFSVMIGCFLEIMGTVFCYQEYAGAKELNRFFNALLFAVAPVPAFLWAMYTHCKVYKNEQKLNRQYKFLAIPILGVFSLSFANLFTDIFFTITEENAYERADFFMVTTMLSAIYILYAVYTIIANWKNIGSSLAVPLLSFMIMSTIGLTLQFVFTGVYLLWVSVAISVIIILNYVQNDYSITDWLTGLYNRRHLDNYLIQTCKRKSTKKIVGLMIDVDEFKQINDVCGHLTGDKALKETAESLKQSLGSKAYVARYAGDEFVAVLQLESEEEIPKVIGDIHKGIEAVNIKEGNPYKLKLSIGYAIFKGADKETDIEFLARMDSEMYLIKKNRKER